MICYASHTGTRRNLAAMREAGWRLMLSPNTRGRDTKGFRYALDNGAWTCFTEGRDFDDQGFQALVDCLGREADWVVAPDIVAGGLRSLQLSVVWLAPLLVRTRMVLVPVQDGMGPQDLVNTVVPGRIGIFLGGSTDWKLKTMEMWGHFCVERGVYYHVGRVNTPKRMQLARRAGADSVDGSSASRYAITLPPLDAASRYDPPQWDMWMPPKNRNAQYAWAATLP